VEIGLIGETVSNKQLTTTEILTKGSDVEICFLQFC